MSEPAFQRIALIGLGLIGASLARAIREHDLAGEIVGFDGSAEVRDRAYAIDLVDRMAPTAAEAVADADLVILCVPVGVCGAVAAEIGPHLTKAAIVSAVGSVKSSVLRDVTPHLPMHVAFVPGHPIAGTEQSGPEAGFAELFDGRWCILTPQGGVAHEAINKVANLWRAMGSDVDIMDAEHHDLVLAITSHVPHLIAYNIVGTVAELETDTRSEVVKYSASGFRDFTRIAASDPVMWRDIFLNNKDAVLEMLGRFSEDLTALQRAIRRGEGDTLLDLFTKTRALRQGVIEAGQETDEPDFGRAHGHRKPDNTKGHGF